MMGRAIGRLCFWLQRTMDTEERFICAACDDRFPGRSAAIQHVIHCHPEFAAVYAAETAGHGWEQSPESCPQPVMPGGALPLIPSAGWT